MDKVIAKWSPGNSCAFHIFLFNHKTFKERKCYKKKKTDGPVLSQTDLYLLNTELEINPILEGKGPNQLQFHLVTGSVSLQVFLLFEKNNNNLIYKFGNL